MVVPMPPVEGSSEPEWFSMTAVRVPVAASPVGENKLVVEQGKNGFCADSAAEWVEAVNNLRCSRDLYLRCSNYALEKAREYSIQKYYPIFKDFVYKTFNI